MIYSQTKISHTYVHHGHGESNIKLIHDWTYNLTKSIGCSTSFRSSFGERVCSVPRILSSSILFCTCLMVLGQVDSLTQTTIKDDLFFSIETLVPLVKGKRVIDLKVKNLSNINSEVTVSYSDLSYHSSLAWLTLKVMNSSCYNNQLQNFSVLTLLNFVLTHIESSGGGSGNSSPTSGLGI